MKRITLTDLMIAARQRGYYDRLSNPALLAILRAMPQDRRRRTIARLERKPQIRP